MRGWMVNFNNQLGHLQMAPYPSAVLHQQKDLSSGPARLEKPRPRDPRTPPDAMRTGPLRQPVASQRGQSLQRPTLCTAPPSAWQFTDFILFTPLKEIALTYYCCSVNDWHKYCLPVTQNWNFFPKLLLGYFTLVFPNSPFPFICDFSWATLEW